MYVVAIVTLDINVKAPPQMGKNYMPRAPKPTPMPSRLVSHKSNNIYLET